MYKAVNKDLTALYIEENKKQYRYKIGKGDSCKAERNQKIECSNDCWHFSNLWQSIAFASNKPHKIISAKVHINDILSVYDKVRVRKFSNVKVVEFNFNPKKEKI
jgi:hypothetical protein